MRLIIPSLRPGLLEAKKLKELDSVSSYEETVYCSNGVYRRQGGDLRRMIPRDAEPVEMSLGGVPMLIDSSAWEELEEGGMVCPDFVVSNRVIRTTSLLLDPKVAFVTESGPDGEVHDAYFRLGADAVEKDAVKEEVQEQVLTLLSKLNFC